MADVLERSYRSGAGPVLVTGPEFLASKLRLLTGGRIPIDTWNRLDPVRDHWPDAFVLPAADCLARSDELPLRVLQPVRCARRRTPGSHTLETDETFPGAARALCAGHARVTRTVSRWPFFPDEARGAQAKKLPASQKTFISPQSTL
jgi:hypothetical protein